MSIPEHVAITTATADPGRRGVRVPVVAEAHAVGEVAQLYERLRPQFFGLVPDVFKLVSSRPELLDVLVAGYESMFAGGDLPRTTKEAIALTVAKTASCQYCATAHDTLLRVVTADPAVAAAIAGGELDDPALPADLAAAVRLAQDITTHAYRITDERLDELRRLGWNDSEILEATWVACIFNAIVRLADTLGLVHLGQLNEPDGGDDR